MTRSKADPTLPHTGTIHVWIDGSCVPNPGKGGWAAIICWPDVPEQVLTGAEANSTNNRMELTAAIQALEALPEGCCVAVHTDSQYVAKGMTEWLGRWERNGWRNADGKPVQNADLWGELKQAAACRTVEWHWVRGHADAAMNVRADRLANAAREELS